MCLGKWVHFKTCVLPAKYSRRFTRGLQLEVLHLYFYTHSIFPYNMTEQLKILLTGHSFVRRLAESGSPPRRFLSSDYMVHLYYKGGSRIGGRNSFISSIDKELCRLENIECIVIQLGNNDIPRYKGDVHLTRLAETYVQLVRELCIRRNIVAVICSEIPRGYMHSCENTSWFNKELERLTSGEMYINFWRHKGLHKGNASVLLPDRVHLNGKGQKKFFYSLQAAIRRAVRNIKVFV